MFEYKEKRYTKMAEKGGAEGKKKKKKEGRPEEEKRFSTYSRSTAQVPKE